VNIFYGYHYFPTLQECGKVTVEGVSSFFNCKALEDVLLRHTVSMKNIVAGSWYIVLVNLKTQRRTILNDVTWLQLKQNFTMLLQNCSPSVHVISRTSTGVTFLR
jgi:hypothetical protein